MEDDKEARRQRNKMTKSVVLLEKDKKEFAVTLEEALDILVVYLTTCSDGNKDNMIRVNPWLDQYRKKEGRWVHHRKVHPRRVHPRRIHPRKVHHRRVHPRRFNHRRFNPRRVHHRGFHTYRGVFEDSLHGNGIYVIYGIGYIREKEGGALALLNRKKRVRRMHPLDMTAITNKVTMVPSSSQRRDTKNVHKMFVNKNANQ